MDAKRTPKVGDEFRGKDGLYVVRRTGLLNGKIAVERTHVNHPSPFNAIPGLAINRGFDRGLLHYFAPEQFES